MKIIINSDKLEPEWKGYKKVYIITYDKELNFFGILKYSEYLWHRNNMGPNDIEITCLPYGFSYKEKSND